MRKTWVLLALLALAFATHSPAQAADPGKTDQKVKYEELLQKYDANKDGKLDPAERTTARLEMAKNKPTTGEQKPGAPLNREALLQKFDANKDGKLDDAEKAQIRQEMVKNKPAGDQQAGQGFGNNPAQPPQLSREELLQKFDANKDGKLDDDEKAQIRQELAKNKPAGDQQAGQGFGNNPPPQPQLSREELLKKYDANGDGKLDDAEKAQIRLEQAKNRPNGEQQQGVAPPTREELIKKFDANGDGKLDDAEKAKVRANMPRNEKGNGGPGQGGFNPGPGFQGGQGGQLGQGGQGQPGQGNFGPGQGGFVPGQGGQIGQGGFVPGQGPPRGFGPGQGGPGGQRGPGGPGGGGGGGRPGGRK